LKIFVRKNQVNPDKHLKHGQISKSSQHMKPWIWVLSKKIYYKSIQKYKFKKFVKEKKITNKALSEPSGQPKSTNQTHDLWHKIGMFL
jgi:hypothetical protein